MNYYNQIFKRKSFHLFKCTENISDEELIKLEAFIKTVKPLNENIKTKITIVPEADTSCKRGAQYCILFYSETKDEYLRNIGYMGEQIDLYLAAQNIGALWFGIGKPQQTQLDGLDFVIMIAIAKMPEDKFRKDMFKAKRKPLCETWQGETINVAEIVRFTPSACNTQPWITENNSNELFVYRYKKAGKRGIMPSDKVSFYNRIDMGIYLFLLETCLTHENYSFNRTLFEDNSDDSTEKTLIARYELMNNTKRFDGKGQLYAKARPKYAAELFEYMKNALNIPSGSVFADIGSGTGIFTQQLLDCGYRVYAVEPNADMRKTAEEKLSGYKDFYSVGGTDVNTTLSDNSVDYITVAQAFHWFNAPLFKKESERILKPGGKIIIVYNSRDIKAECTKALAELRQRFNPEFHGFSNGISDEKCRAFFGNNCTVFKCDNSLTYDRQGYIDRLLSSSYSLKEDDPMFCEYIDSIGQLFDRFAVNGKITVPTNTVAYIG